MSAVAVPTPGALPRRRPARLAQFRDLAMRAIRSTARGGDALILPIVFPLIILAINVKALHAILGVPGFPTKNVTSFAIALTFLQGALFSGIACASRMAADIESGFIKRIALAPVSMLTVLDARLAGVALAGAVEAVFFIAAARVGGAHVAAGVGGVIALIALSILFNMAFAGVGILLAVRTRSGEAVQSLFPIFFVFVMLSSALMPLSLIDVTWFRDVAEANPATYMLDAVRSLFIGDGDLGELALGAGVAAAVLLLTSALSLKGMRRMVVTP